MNIDIDLLKTRVKGRVTFLFFQGDALYYRTDDGYQFPVPLSDTTNETGDQPVFWAESKAIYYMRWIRKQMEKE